MGRDQTQSGLQMFALRYEERIHSVGKQGLSYHKVTNYSLIYQRLAPISWLALSKQSQQPVMNQKANPEV